VFQRVSAFASSFHKHKTQYLNKAASYRRVQSGRPVQQNKVLTKYYLESHDNKESMYLLYSTSEARTKFRVHLLLVSMRKSYIKHPELPTKAQWSTSYRYSHHRCDFCVHLLNLPILSLSLDVRARYFFGSNPSVAQIPKCGISKLGDYKTAET